MDRLAARQAAQVDDNILTVVGEIHMPLMELSRRMTAVRLDDSRLVVFSAIALDEEDVAQCPEGMIAHALLSNHKFALRAISGSII